MFAILLVCLLGSFAYATPGFRPSRQAATCGQTFVANKVSFSADGTPLKRIVGGIEATPHSIPWQVSLRTKRNQHFCGGSLVRVNNQDKSDIIVTAAHCLEVEIQGRLMNFTETDLDVVLGAHIRNRQANGEQKLAVGKIAKHPGWVYPTVARPNVQFNNDIAILKLATPITFSKTIQPICLPSSSSDNPADGSFGIVSGWGDTFEGQQQGSDVLRQVTVPVVGSDNCARVYGGLDRATNLCGGYTEGGKDSCQGDSGGPYVFKKPQGFVLYGVVSNGAGCAQRGVPGLYSRVSNYIPWITQKIRELSSIK